MFGFDLPTWAIGLVGAVGAPLALQLLGLFLPNKVVRGTGIATGKFVTVFFRQRIGKQYERVEKGLQGTLAAFIEGLHEGLDFDD